MIIDLRKLEERGFKVHIRDQRIELHSTRTMSEKLAEILRSYGSNDLTKDLIVGTTIAVLEKAALLDCIES